MENKISNSFELLQNGPFELNDSLYDRVFLTGKAIETDCHGFSIYIDSGMPLARLNERVESPGVTVKEIAEIKDFSLISANYLLWINEGGRRVMPLLRRDLGAPVYAGALTASAGRCEQSPRATALSELNQEMLIQIRNKETEEISILGFGDIHYAKAGLLHKEKALKRKFEEKVMILPILKIPGPDRYQLYSSTKIVELGNCLVIYDQATNCYELTFEGEVFLPYGCEIFDILDGEGYGRTGHLFSSLEEIKKEELVPALRGWIDSKNK